jgi:hypothetical protein
VSRASGRRRRLHAAAAANPPPLHRRTATNHWSHRLIREHRRRSSFSPPPRRQGTPVTYRLHPHARWVASPPWVLKRCRLLHLHHCSATAGHAAKRARRAVTAPTCVQAPRRAAQAKSSPASRGPHALCTGASQRCGRGPRALCTRAELALWAWATRDCATGPSAVSAQWQSN